jgi:hypothetical protein
MKYFLTILLGLISFLSPAQVSIKPETARFYLELYDKYQVMIVKDSMQTELISNLREKENLLIQAIGTYKQDSITYNGMLVTKERQLTLKDKEIKKEKRLKVVSWIGTGVVIILALL